MYPTVVMVDEKRKENLSHLFMTRDFRFLREQVDALEKLVKWERTGRVRFPRVKGESREEEDAIEIGDLLTATLGALASATRQLRGGGTGIALGSNDPITIKLTGRLIGVSATADQILIDVKPASKEGKNG